MMRTSGGETRISRIAAVLIEVLDPLGVLFELGLVDGAGTR